MRYRSPKLTVDAIITKNNEILLIKRKKQPFKDFWALPGGFVNYGEKTEDAVVREVLEETGLKCRVKKLLNVYSEPNRDPRGHTVSIVYHLTVINNDKPTGGDDAADARFFNIKDIHSLPLAFDHRKIIKDYLTHKKMRC
ncbi:ADP-ribose pyrophosphatase [Euryarchaeota archaeon ex4484_162]|nr:MAG: NUDIX hydrolase [Thermoplasmata archaeon]OYT58218.1 MAG: ADP-ribose pyrophosphatase [Euryarchaeota archaeon ex4484_162]HDM25028.1 NUDIX hydrolase [Thermoplasmatales archaeon]MCD6107930.1 NUDIX hydrolase [Thermoplasmata archaeon]RLF30884.1 MAG: ADP-ribose pyrophosphatase [Thermoplasmata archaeon]